MSSPEMAAEATEDNNMEVNGSGGENEDKAGNQTELANLGGMGNASPETISEATGENNMEVSRSSKENKVKAEKQPEVSSLGATPSQINEAKNTPPDNHTPVDKSEPEKKKTKKSTRAEKLMKCPKCQAAIAPSVTFCKHKNDQYEFNIGLHLDSGDNHTPFLKDKLTSSRQPEVANRQCPNCEYSFPVNHSWTNRMGGFDIEFSIDIPKEKKLEGETVEKSAKMDDLGEGMEQDDMNNISSQKLPGSNTDKPFWSRMYESFSNRAESRKSSSRKPEQSNQTTNSEGSSLFSRLPAILLPPTPVVKVHYTPTSDTFGADAAIMNQLKNNLTLVKTTRGNCSVIVVFCPVNRSFESEIRSAMEKEAVSSSGKPVILVLMHHTRDPDYSTAGCDCLEMLKNVFYVHVFYHETEKGLLRCNQNDTAIKAIERKLQTYKQ